MGTGRDGRSEIDRLLGDIYPRRRKPGRGLGDVIRNPNEQGHVVGPVTYADGPQRQKGGPEGTDAQKVEKKLEKILDGIDLSKCGPLGDPNCLELLSRMLEQTFRNFQLTARPPSHVKPPYGSTPIDAFGVTGGVALPAVGAAGAFTDICSFQMPAGSKRGEITHAGQCLESEFAFNDVEWRIVVDTTPSTPWNGFFKHLWNFLPPTELAAPVHLQGNQTVRLQARAILNPHTADGRLTGWHYLMRANVGGLTAQSTIVD